MSEGKITTKQFVALSEKIKKTKEDETPYPQINDGQLQVIGNANKTEVKKNSYTIKFRFPMSLFDEQPEGSVINGPYYHLETQFEDVIITPRKDLAIVDSIVKMEPFLKSMKENGDVEELSDREAALLFTSAPYEAILGMYNLVATFLEIDDVIAEYMLPFSVITTLIEFVDNHPEVFNEADAFFG